MNVANATAARRNGDGPSYEERCEKLLALAEEIRRRRREMVRAAVADVQFTAKDSEQEVDNSPSRVERLLVGARRDASPVGYCAPSLASATNGHGCVRRESHQRHQPERGHQDCLVAKARLTDLRKGGT